MSNRKLIWIPVGEKKKGVSLPICPPIPLEDPAPSALWIINNFMNPEIPPPVTMELKHGDSAFLETKGHDWNVRMGSLYYRGNYSEGGTWAILEY